VSAERYRDPTAPVAERVGDLLDRMSVAEKVAQLTSIWLTLDVDTGEVAPSQTTFGGTPAWSPRQALASGVGQITRLLGSRPVDPSDGARMVNEVQRQLTEGTRLGIPAICHEECLAGAMFDGATSFPSPLNLASTWDPGLVQEMTSAIARQMRAVGATQGLAPVADVARDARWGRVEETLGEDPYLVGLLVSAYVRGLQGSEGGATGDLRTGVIATLKHFCGYSFSEGGRNFAPTHVGPRELADVFLVPFEMAVREGGALSVMNAYQEIDGQPPAASRQLLTAVLRDEWGFAGFTVADYGAIQFLQNLHKVAADSAEAAALAIHAGLDVELPNPVDYPGGIPEALDRGLLDQADVDLSVGRVLGLKFRLGLFEHPFVDVAAVPAALSRPEDAALGAEIARRSIVLLHNTGILPLVDPIPGGSAGGRGRVAVIGPNAADPLALFGNYSFENHIVSTHFADQVDAVDAPTVLDALAGRLGEDRVVHEPGCTVQGGGTEGIAVAAAAAASADLVVLVLGDRAGHFNLGTVGEGSDTAHLGLPGEQSALADAVLDAGTPTVVILLAGRPHAISGIKSRAAAVVQAWFPGSSGAGAITDVLFGDAEPTGRSPITFSAGAGTMPRFYNHKLLAMGVPRQADFEPVFPFGHGLSYTTFEYSDLGVTPAEVPADGEFSVSCTVANTGDRPGDEVVQLYLHDRLASVTRPVMELKGFARAAIEPGASARITFTVPADLLSFSGPDLRRRVEPGRFSVLVGASAEDIRLAGRLDVVGEVRVVGSGRRLTSTSVVSPEPG
jgi:beta-glucosidase-like glycosyl hydrolase